MRCPRRIHSVMHADWKDETKVCGYQDCILITCKNDEPCPLHDQPKLDIRR